MAQSYTQDQPSNTMEQTRKSQFLRLTLKECLTLFIGTAIPVAIGIYTSINNEQMQKSAKLAAEEQERIAAERRAFDLERAAELYQQQLYKDFLDAMYTLDKDGKLNDSAKPWAFANARYRAAHREFDSIRKAQTLLFLKEKELIGRQKCITGCEEKNITDIINLNGLNFDNLNLSSETGNLSRLDLSCVEFNRVSLINAIFSHANLNGVIFRDSRLNGAQFKDTSLNCSKIINTELYGTSFDNSDLNSILFNNVDLSTAILTQEQKQGAYYDNVILPNGTKITSITMMTPIIIEKTSTLVTTTLVIAETTTLVTTETTTTNITRIIIPNISVNATWSQNSITIAGNNEQGDAINQLSSPYGLFIDNDNQTVLVADSGNHRIIRWKIGDANGQVVAGGNGNGDRLDQLTQPSDVLVDKESDSLIICDFGNERVVRWYRRVGTTQGEILTDSFGCFGLAIDDQRYLYVADAGKHDIRRYQLGGDMQDETIVASWSGGLSTTLPPSYYIFVDRQQIIYVSECSKNRVMKWSKGAKKGVLVAGGQGTGNDLTQLSGPRGLFVDTLGTVYVADSGNQRVTRWPQGAVQGTVIFGGQGQLFYPMDLSFDLQGQSLCRRYECSSDSTFSYPIEPIQHEIDLSFDEMTLYLSATFNYVFSAIDFKNHIEHKIINVLRFWILRVRMRVGD